MGWCRSLTLPISITGLALGLSTSDSPSFSTPRYREQKQKAANIVKQFMVLSLTVLRIINKNVNTNDWEQTLLLPPRNSHKPQSLWLEELFCFTLLSSLQFLTDNILRVRNGVPGLSIGVTRNGRSIWKEGFGYADVEQLVPCKSDTVMRIASISKPITAALAARLVQSGKLDLDASIQNYVPDFPKKKYKDKEVTITIRQLLSHTSGIRHYKTVTIFSILLL
uniref:Beta-lactamase-related domain-containing protein n=1 Tax=Setaria digitata TaxID=48799 RepID=A0A915Q372_9BILA